MLKCALLLTLAIGLQAQSFRPFTVGALQCGLVKRGADTVQLYCYGPQRVLYFNSISKVYSLPSDSPGLEIRYGYGADQIKILLNIVAGGIYYEVVSSASGFTGVLIDVFASTGPGCGFPANLPRYQWTAGNRSCITAWSDAWLDCCVGAA